MKSVQWSSSSFRIDGILGKGKFGEVYEALHIESKQLVAIKKISKEFLIKNKFVTQLRREIEIHSRLIHPCIIRFMGYYTDEGFIYIVMELADNQTLYHYIKAKHKLEIAEIKKVEHFAKRDQLSITKCTCLPQ